MIWLNTIICGDVFEYLRKLPEKSIHAVVTSPPYYGQRDYGMEGQIGLENSPQAYIDRLVSVFAEIWRVLRDDGVVWLNLGDSYATSGGDLNKRKADRIRTGQKTVVEQNGYKGGNRVAPRGFKPKDLMLIPHRVAIALQESGWWVRNDAVWHRHNAMPEPVQDRLVQAHEYVFLLTKSAQYWFDVNAIREPYTKSLDRWGGDYLVATGDSLWNEGTGQTFYRDRDMRPDPRGRLRRSVLTVNTVPSDISHFAMFPFTLIAPLILGGCPPCVCAQCSAPYKHPDEEIWLSNPHRPQSVQAEYLAQKHGLTLEHLQAVRSTGMADAGKALKTMNGAGHNLEKIQQLAQEAKQALGGYFREFVYGWVQSERWVKSCRCKTQDTVSGVVLDPFMGSGTTALAARRLGRQFAGCELNPAYVEIALQRLSESYMESLF